MILQSLSELATREHLLANPDYEPRPVRWLVTVGADGDFIGLESTLGIASGKKKPQAKQFLIPRRSGRTSAASADFLVDKSEYVLGVEPNGVRAENDLTLRRQLFRDKTADCERATHDRGVHALLQFLDREDARDACLKRLSEAGYESNDLFGFLFQGTPVHDSPAVQRYFSSLRREANVEQVVCLVCGENKPPVPKHPPVKVPGGSTSGVALVSFNASAFESYGLSGNQNASVCRDCADAYTTALSRCLSPAYPDPMREGQTLGRRNVRLSYDTTAVYWAEDDSSTLDLFAALFESGDPNDVAALLSSTRTGTASARLASRFYCLILSGAQGRATLRGVHTGVLEKVEENIGDYFRSLNVGQDGPAPLFVLLSSLCPQGKLERLPPGLATDLFLAVLSGAPFPRIVLAAALERCRAEQRVTWPRAALLKAVLNRKDHKNEHEEVGVSLNTELHNPGYLLGRLLAILERLQGEAQGNPNKTIVDRYYSAASTRPSMVFPNLLRLSVFHTGKLKNSIPSQKRIGEVMDALPAFPAKLTLDQQAFFALGYYQQRQDFFKKRDEPGTTVTTEATPGEE